MSAVEDLHAEALFCSCLQPSEHPDLPRVFHEAEAALFRHGEDGLAELVAQEFGDHPEAAAERMCWCVEQVQDAFPLTGVR